MTPRRFAFLHSLPSSHRVGNNHSHSGTFLQSCRPIAARPILHSRQYARIITACAPNSSSEGQASDPSKGKNGGPSRTLVGRFIVETLALLVGVVLLFLVLIWRASQYISRTAFRAFLWLANVRQLGKWAVGHLAGIDSIAVPVASFGKAVNRVYESALLRIMRIGRDTVSGSVVETPARQPNDVEVAFEELSDSGVKVEEDVPTVEPLSGRRLILLRHAKTMWDRDAETPDHDRVLSSRGKEEAKLVGSELSRLSWQPDVVLCSDAVRTVQTLSLLDMPEKSPGATTCTESLYYAVTGDEMAVAVDGSLGDNGFVDDTTLMIVCHNPGCEELVEQLTGRRVEMGTGCAALMKYCGSEECSEEQSIAPFRLSPQQSNWELVELIRPAGL